MSTTELYYRSGWAFAVFRCERSDLLWSYDGEKLLHGGSEAVHGDGERKMAISLTVLRCGLGWPLPQWTVTGHFVHYGLRLGNGHPRRTFVKLSGHKTQGFTGSASLPARIEAGQLTGATAVRDSL